MKKYALICLVVVVAIFLLFPESSYPEKLEFRQIILGSMEDINNTLDKEFDIFSYRDQSNNHVLIFGIRNDSVRTLDDFSELYLSSFRRQGFDFDSADNRHLGAKGDEVIYMTELGNIEGVVIYIEKGSTPAPLAPGEAAMVFADLESLSF